MNHEKTFKFPSSEVSASAMSLMRGLITAAAKRLNYETVVRHDFFRDTNWNDLAALCPPVVPVVKSPDDTSNFEEEFDEPFSQLEPASLAERPAQPGIAGHQLPFIGFTFSRTGAVPESESSGQSYVTLNSTFLEPKAPGELEVELRQTKKMLHEARLQLKRFSEKPVKAAEIGEDLKSAALMQDLTKARESLVKLTTKNEKLVSFINKERSERSENEKKAIEMAKQANEKWKQKLSECKEEIEFYKKCSDDYIEKFRAAAVEQKKLAENYEKRKMQIKVLQAAVSKKVTVLILSYSFYQC